MLLDITDCFTAPAGVLTPYAPTAIASANNGQFIDRMVKMEDGAGEDIIFTVFVVAAVTSAGAATVQFQLLGNATDSTFASGNVILADSGAIAKATLVAGYRVLAVKIPRSAWASYEKQNAGPLRYYAFQVIIGTAVLTAGSFNAWLTTDPVQDNLAYPAGYTV